MSRGETNNATTLHMEIRAMAYRGGWTESTMWNGEYRTIRGLLIDGTHTLEIWGCSADGWAAYLVRNGIGLQVGPIFHPRNGERMGELKDAAVRAYGIKRETIKSGRRWL